jgi:hypothetical protein
MDAELQAVEGPLIVGALGTVLMVTATEDWGLVQPSAEVVTA